jgi:thymidylate synthase
VATIPQTAVSPGSRTSQSFGISFQKALSDIVEDGTLVAAGASSSVGGGRSTREVLNYGFTLPEARDRLLAVRPISAIGAVGRFIWMLSGSDRLADIAFYEPKVVPFTDDGLSVPGSDYGARLFNPRPGANQVKAASKVMREEPGTRRAAASVYFPEDAGRESHDIPCTFGLAWQPRDGVLHATTIMRSNNAWTLLPYNVFEFTLLAELIAADLDLELGSYHHFAVSMHIYEEHIAAAKEALSRVDHETAPGMQPIPREDPWTSSKDLLNFEVALRYSASGLKDVDILTWLRRAAELGSFWSDLGVVVVAAAVRNGEMIDSAQTVIDSARDPWKSLLAVDLHNLVQKAKGESILADSSKIWMPYIRSLISSPPADSKHD